jgi:hypothetical protein
VLLIMPTDGVGADSQRRAIRALAP